MGEEPGEDGQCPNTRENLTKIVYKKINEIWSGLFPCWRILASEKRCRYSNNEIHISFSGIWAQSVVSGHLCSGWRLKESLVLSIQIREPRENHDEPATFAETEASSKCVPQGLLEKIYI